MIEIGQHGHLSGSLHPAHAHMHGGWYASGMGALGASSGLQSGFSSGGLAGGVVPHSQSYHLMVSKLPDFKLLLIAFPKKLTWHSWNTFSVPIFVKFQTLKLYFMLNVYRFSVYFSFKIGCDMGT